MNDLHLQHAWFLVVFWFCAALVLANVIHYVIFRVLRRKEAETSGLGWGVQRHLGRPARAVFLLTCLLLVLPLLPGMTELRVESIRQWLLIALVGALGWFVIGLVYVVQAVLLRRYDLHGENSVRARRVHTQFQLFRRMIIGFVVT